MSVNLPGTKQITAIGSVTRSVRLTGGPLETFGSGSLSIRYSRNDGLSQIRATVSVKGSKTPVSVGAARIKRGSGVVKIPLLDEAVLLPRGRRIVVAVGGIAVGGVYLPFQGGPGELPVIKIGRVTLNLSLLKKTVSR